MGSKVRIEKMAGSLWKNLSRISLGVVLVLFWAWMYLRAPQLFPTNTEAWQFRIQTYIIFTALIFALDGLASRKSERPLFDVGFFKAFPKFLIAGAITLVVLFLFGLTLKGSALPTIYGAISSTGLGVILFHAFLVAVIEERIFRTWLPNELLARGVSKNLGRWIIPILVFTMFHYTLNGDWISLAIYIPLGALFTWAKLKYSPKTDMANSGVHFAWNFFVLGFMS